MGQSVKEIGFHRSTRRGMDCLMKIIALCCAFLCVVVGNIQAIMSAPKDIQLTSALSSSSFPDESVESGPEISFARSTVQSKKDTVSCFAVSDEGQIACAYNNWIIEIYDSNLRFQYELSFNHSASYAILWEKENLIVLTSRTDKLIEVDPYGTILRIESMDSTDEQEDTFYEKIRQIKSRTELEKDGYLYCLHRSDIVFSGNRTVSLTRQPLPDGAAETIASSTEKVVPLSVSAAVFILLIALIGYDVVRGINRHDND